MTAMVSLQVSVSSVMIRNPIHGNTLAADEATTIITMNSKLYVGNMSFKTSEADLRDAFSQFGSITDVYIANDRETGRPRGFAFVTFSTDTESNLAAEKMNGSDLDGRQLTVNDAKPTEEMRGDRNFGSDRRAGSFQ